MTRNGLLIPKKWWFGGWFIIGLPPLLKVQMHNYAYMWATNISCFVYFSTSALFRYVVVWEEYRWATNVPMIANMFIYVGVTSSHTSILVKFLDSADLRRCTFGGILPERTLISRYGKQQVECTYLDTHRRQSFFLVRLFRQPHWETGGRWWII